MMKKKDLDDSFSDCRDLVARDDPDRYLASLFAPYAARPGIWAILAFNQDIARVRDSVTDPTLGLIRLQWIRDQIAAIYKRISERSIPFVRAEGNGKILSSLDSDSRLDDIIILPGSPVYRALAAVIVEYDLPCDFFNMLMDAREFDLNAEGPKSRTELLDYADQTTTPLLRLCAKIIFPRQGGMDDLRDISVAYALIGCVRASSFHTDSRGWNMIPEGDDLSTIIKLARGYLDKVKPYRTLAPMFRAMGHIADIYARQVEKVGFNLDHPSLIIPPPFLALRVWVQGRGMAFFS